ncbi:MAG: PD-(D/E)XK nuclease family protein, partial [Nitrospiria bacterium]
DIRLITGLSLHTGMEVLLKEGSHEHADAAVCERFNSFFKEGMDFPTQQQKALARALVRAWYRTRYSAFIERFEILSIEEEVSALLAPNITLQGRVDAVTRDRRDGTILVWNWKSTSSMKDWQQKWDDDIQAKTEALLTQERLGENVLGCIFEGFYKGSMYKGVSTSPLITGYVNSKTGMWRYDAPSGSGEKRAEWNKVPVWDEQHFKGGLKEWIDWLPEDVVAEQFIRSEPVFKNDHEVREWLKQVVKEESDNEYVLSDQVSEEDRLIHFKQNKGFRCQWCTFRPACRYEMEIGAMVDAGLLVSREANHPDGGRDAGLEPSGS